MKNAGQIISLIGLQEPWKTSIVYLATYEGEVFLTKDYEVAITKFEHIQWLSSTDV